jgi:hypothetical protein
MADVSVNVNWHGSCVDVTAIPAKIVEFRTKAAEKDTIVHDGKCSSTTDQKCENTHGFKICADKDGGADTSDLLELDDVVKITVNP